MLRHALALLLTTLPVGGLLHGQGLAPLPGNLETVATGGYWDTGRQSGHYRVVILVSGFEEVESTVHLQWLYNGGSESDTTQILASVPVRELNDKIFHYGNVRFKYLDGRTTITLDAVNVETPVGQHEEWQLLVGAPGVYTVATSGLRPDSPRE